jgi:2-dehydro-3-deoxy-D-arabinonate dehydratase
MESLMHIVRYQPAGETPAVGVLHEDRVHRVAGVGSVADLLARPVETIRDLVDQAVGAEAAIAASDVRLLPPLDGRGEVWCSGVTYERSRGARMEESSERSVYDKVYVAERPELFMKSPAWRVVTDGEPIGIRADSGHDVPEPELAVVVNAHGQIVGFTVCDDMSSRSIEGENPLYIPQAKMFAGGCALSAGIRPAWEVTDPLDLSISIDIRRDGASAFTGTTSTRQLTRKLEDLVDYLCRANTFPDGAILATGTGIVPELDFRLEAGDEIDIEVEQVGRLRNRVVVGVDPFTWLDDDKTARPTLEETR